MIAVNWYPSAQQLRQFAAAGVVGFSVLGMTLWQYAGSRTPALMCLALAGAMPLVGLVRPTLLRPFYVLLTVLSLPIGLLISALVVRLLYYGLITPIGLIFRLIGRDALCLRRAPAQSYWRKHDDRAGVGSYYRQT